MRFQAFLILIAAIFVVTGCGGRARYDGRLVQADSLMWSPPDSALAVLSALDTLRGAADSAYRDLLFTQARYKTYQDITASDDSAITRALHWYRAHNGEREKFTRANLYKGAVMEELGRIDSAMIYYKTAEAAADTTDYYNRGYSKMRIAELYQNQHSQNSNAISKAKEAISCFEHINDTTFLITCYGMLGAINGVKNPDSTEFYLSKAIELSRRFDPPRQYTFKSKLAGFVYYHDKDYPRANRLAMDVLRNGSEHSLEYQFYYYAVMTYLKMGQIDSAKFVLGLFPPPIDAVDSMNRLDAMAEVAKAEGDLLNSKEHAVKSTEEILDILAESKEVKLIEAEHAFKSQQAESNEKSARSCIFTLTVLLAVVAISFVLSLWLWRRFLKLKENERQAMMKELNATINALDDKLRLANNMNANTSALVRYRLDAFQELFDSIKFRTKREENSKKRTVVSLSSILGEIGGQYQMMKVALSDSFWERLRISVDGEFNGIVTYVEKHYPNLTARDLRIFCLVCTNVTPQVIKICMNLTNVKTASNYKSNIMKKIGLEITFDEFVKKYMSQGFCE